MTLYAFKSLTEDEQTELIWNEGDFVADRQKEDHCILLYRYMLFMLKLLIQPA
ncbi:hypothetical protein [Segetibacter koreensis]|uniref:hypothetical protein n=1 Tax=Segetibacter koreensis TaxID=398037 RepID=UPI00039F188B|nr:hypothetical protein [Segetibacter koreensis]